MVCSWAQWEQTHISYIHIFQKLKSEGCPFVYIEVQSEQNPYSVFIQSSPLNTGNETTVPPHFLVALKDKTHLAQDSYLSLVGNICVNENGQVCTLQRQYGPSLRWILEFFKTTQVGLYTARCKWNSLGGRIKTIFHSIIKILPNWADFLVLLLLFIFLAMGYALTRCWGKKLKLDVISCRDVTF